MKPRRQIIAVRCTQASASHLLKAGKVYSATFEHPPVGQETSGTLLVQIQTKKETLVKRYPRSMFTPINPDHAMHFPAGGFEPIAGETLKAA
ncbi:hypothetical protein [Asticcacaulis excentricus]|uniref:Uncharacterized protein n=1 Tax=Asticcacaulis excentricus (strain ATCC 15261 / DSM 4724 / KCTC 12464 / NCIMB 9791 / VKM B-1370 / CB 48) TaxID=573065 RepID=E8RPN3_ASTEC|nr:hypothetical protein [Asticcacaulis excentricus]ADU12010.1 hypothetical protein Astex_0312 [Asticcacaulis excentricus CB 48]